MGVTLAQTFSAPLIGSERREALAQVSRQLAFLAFNGAIVLSPFRARILIEERPLPPMFPDYTDMLLFWNQLFILAALVLWGASLLLGPRRIDFGPALIWAPVLGLAAAICLSGPFAETRALTLYTAVTLVGFMAFGLYVANEVKSVTQLLPAIAVMVVVQAVVAITQVIDQAPFGLMRLGELNLDPAVPGTSILWTEGEGVLLRGYGMSDHPNILGGLLAASALVVAGSIGRLREEWVAVLCAVFGLAVAAILVTFSRSAALGLAVGIAAGLVLLLAIRDWRTLRLWLVACLVAAIVTVPFVKSYMPYLEARGNPTAQAEGSTEARSLSERSALLQNTKELFFDNPLVGVGAGGLPTAMWVEYPDFEYNYGPAHLAIAVVAAETGVLGAAAYGVLMLAPWVLLWRSRDRLTSELIGVSCALLALQVIGLFDYYTWSLNAGRIWFWMVLGLWVMAYRNATTSSVRDGSSERPDPRVASSTLHQQNSAVVTE